MASTILCAIRSLIAESDSVSRPDTDICNKRKEGDRDGQRSASLGGGVQSRKTRTSSSSQTSVRPKSWAEAALLLPLPFLLLADDASGSVRSIGRAEADPDAFAPAKPIVVGPLGRAGPLDGPATLNELVFLGVDGERTEPDDPPGPSRTRPCGRIEGEACRPVGDPSSGSESGNDGRPPLRRRFLIASLLLG